MPSRLATARSSAPGTFGLNTEDSSATLPLGWATVAKNAVINSSGRLAARKGSKVFLPTTSTGDITSLHEYIDLAGNSIFVYFDDNIGFFRTWNGASVAGAGPTGGIAPPDSTWQFANFNGKCVAFQDGFQPYVLSATNGLFTAISGAPFGSAVLAAFGRIWVIQDSNVWYSPVLNEAGTYEIGIDLRTVWGSGGDSPVALAEYNGYLVVFGKRNIAVYNNPWVPNAASDWLDTDQMSLVERIEGIGCIARDSIANTGDDLLFLSDSGVRSLGRTIQEKSNPTGDLSQNVRGQLLLDMNTALPIKGVYHANEAFYLLTNGRETYTFDTRRPNQDGSARVTLWDIGFFGFSSGTDGELRMVTKESAASFDYSRISLYSGFKDFVGVGTGTAATAATYEYEFKGPWIDLQEGEVGDRLKIGKYIGASFQTGAGQQINLEYSFDYDDLNFKSRAVTGDSVTASEYGVAEYGIGEWGAGFFVFNRDRKPSSNSGQVFKFGCTTTIDNLPFALNEIFMQVKIGRIV